MDKIIFFSKIRHNFMHVIYEPCYLTQMEGDKIVKKLQGVFRKEYQHDNSSDDDVPITKYARNHDTGLDVPDNIKELIRNEINRVIHMKPMDKCKEETKRKMEAKKKGTIKKKKVEVPVVKAVDNTLDVMATMAPEVAFADVNDIKENQMLDVKDEIPNSLTPLGGLYLFSLSTSYLPMSANKLLKYV